MKKMIRLFLAIMFLWLSVGCATEITTAYPEIENSYFERHYEELDELSNKRKLSFSELSWKFLEVNGNEELNELLGKIKNYFEVEFISILEIREKYHDEIQLCFSVKVLDKVIPVEMKIYEETVSSQKNADEFEYVYIFFDLSNIHEEERISYEKEILICIGAYSEYNIMKMHDSYYIENKIYIEDDDYIILPARTEQLRIYQRDVKAVPSGYKNITGHFNSEISKLN